MSFEGQEYNERYRPELDGLRALAVAAILAFHAGFDLLPGGYLGVDIFFVISGYLITAILMRSAEAGGIALGDFYLRRARRILPALFVMLGVALAAAMLLPTPEATSAFGASLAAATAFAANFWFWRASSGYFAMNSETMPLLHLWSLAVEEQFYLLYPVALMLLLRFARRRLMLSLAAAALASLALSELLASIHPTANYFLLPGRAWELLAGALVALHAERRPVPAESRLAGPAAWLGLALLVAPLFVIGANARIPGLLALPTVIGTALVIRFARPGGGAARLLSLQPLVGLGLISFSLYLWHQPVLAFARMFALNRLGTASTLALLALSLALAVLSWRFVEQPFRAPGERSRWRFALAAASAAATLFAAGAALRLSHGLPERLPPHALALSAERKTTLEGFRACFLDPGRPPGIEQACSVGGTGPVTAAMVGDSHAMALVPAIARAAASRGQRVRLLMRSGCPPVLDGTMIEAEERTLHCTAHMRAALAYLARHREIRTVVIASHWIRYVERSTFDNGEGGREPELHQPAVPERVRARFRRSLASVVAALLADGRRVVLVYPAPEIGWDVPLYLAKETVRRLDARAPLTVSAARFSERSGRARAMLDAIPDRPRLARLDPARALCGTLIPGRCVAALDGWPLYVDSNHLGARGALIALPLAPTVAAMYGP